MNESDLYTKPLSLDDLLLHKALKPLLPGAIEELREVERLNVDGYHPPYTSVCATAANLLAKTRYYVPHNGFVWEVDVYEGILDGVVLADIEIANEDVEVPLPNWIGNEVTGRPEYKKLNMLRMRRANQRALAKVQ
jgi:hypothetical protein